MFRLRTQLPTFYRFAAGLALLAMLTPAATGLIHHPAATQNMAPQTMSDCGMNMGTSNTHPIKPTEAPQKAPTCPICQSLHVLGGGFVPPEPPAALIHIAVPLVILLKSWTVFHAAFLGEPQARPRAPPLFP